MPGLQYPMTTPLMKTLSFTFVLTILATALAGAGDFSPKRIIPVLDAKTPITDAKAPIKSGSCLSYDYIDLDYGMADFSSPLIDDDATSYGVNFSKSLGELFFLTGGYTNAGTDYLSGNQFFDLESHQYNLGLGAHFGLSQCVDFTIEAGVQHSDNRFGGGNALSYDTWAYYVAPGLRARFGRLESFAKIYYFEREGVPAGLAFDNDGWVFNPGLLFHLNDTLALKAAASFGETSSGLTLGARIHF